MLYGYTHVLPALDSVLMSVLGYDLTTGVLYGTDRNQRGFLMSEDRGDTVYSISAERWGKAKLAAGIVLAKDVWLSEPQILTATLNSLTFATWKGKWSVIHIWSSDGKCLYVKSELSL